MSKGKEKKKESGALTIGEVMDRRAVVVEFFKSMEKYKDRKIVGLCSSRGTMEEWKHIWDMSLGGAGEYELSPNEVLVVMKDGKRTPPNDSGSAVIWPESRTEGNLHPSVRRFYGAVFFGVFFQLEPKVELV